MCLRTYMTNSYTHFITAPSNFPAPVAVGRPVGIIDDIVVYRLELDLSLALAIPPEALVRAAEDHLPSD